MHNSIIKIFSANNLKKGDGMKIYTSEEKTEICKVDTKPNSNIDKHR